MKLDNFHLYRLVSIWWVRIIIWLILIFFLSLPVFLISNPILIALYIFFVLLILSILIESLRAGGSIISLGFYFDKKTFYELILLVLITCGAFLIFFLVNYIVGGKVISFERIDFDYFTKITLLIFIYAASEELIFRGIVFQALIEKFNPMAVSIFISLIFAIAHYFNPNFSIIAFMNIFLGGLLLSILYLRTYSLIYPIIFHFLWNWLQAVLLSSPISGNEYGIGIFVFERPHNWTFHLLLGNQFGIEEGLISTIVIIFISLVIVNYFEPNPYITSRIFQRKYDESKIIWNRINANE